MEGSWNAVWFDITICLTLIKEAGGPMNYMITHQIFLKFIDVICLAINFHLVMKIKKNIHVFLNLKIWLFCYISI